MKTIVFCVHPLVGGINSSLKLAKNLKGKGWVIVYFGVSQCRKYIEPHGFDFVTVYDDFFSEEVYFYDKSNIWPLSFFVWLKNARLFWRNYKNFIKSMISGEDREIINLFEKYSPDLVLILTTEYDSIIWAILANKLGFKCAYLSSILSHTECDTTPPICSSRIPTQSFWGRVNTVLTWKKYFFIREIKSTFLSALGIGVRFDFTAKILAKAYNYSIDEINIKTDLLSPLINIPELVLWPACFEFKNVNQQGRYYLEPSIDLSRNENDFAWERIDHECALIYCSMGTVSSRKKEEYIRFYKVIIDAAKELTSIQWLIAIGTMIAIDDLGVIPKNVIVVINAPQIAVLKKAKYMINHGGANSVKECIYLGVPMLVFPLEFDHFGNAAKVVYHKLGLCGKFLKVNKAMLINLINKLNGNEQYRVNLSIMQNKFKELELQTPSIKIIESMLGY
jgi:zeaxanthin glucosyltransferase